MGNYSKNGHCDHSVLVVNDLPDQLYLMDLALRNAGYRVFCAEDGQEGIEVARRERPDLIISDVTMPGLDGPSLIKQLRARGIITPVILMTGRVDSDGLAHAQDSDTISVLAKPFSFREIVRYLKQILEEGNLDLVGTAAPGTETRARSIEPLTSKHLPWNTVSSR